MTVIHSVKDTCRRSRASDVLLGYRWTHRRHSTDSSSRTDTRPSALAEPVSVTQHTISRRENEVVPAPNLLPRGGHWFWFGCMATKATCSKLPPGRAGATGGSDEDH